MIDKQLMKSYFSEMGLSVPGEKLDLLDSYAEFLVEYNEKVNLTAITQPEEIARKHFADSLSLLCHGKIHPESSLIDVGTGAGFPSVPIKIVRPDIKVTLLDSLNKRIVFLHQLCERLNLDDVTFIHARAEEGGQRPELREKFDFATARAVAHLRELSEYCLPFVKVGGCFLALKGPNMENELFESEKAIGILGGKVLEIVDYTLPDSEDKRTLVVIEKIHSTPKNYPRPAAKIAKKPLQ